MWDEMIPDTSQWQPCSLLHPPVKVPKHHLDLLLPCLSLLPLTLSGMFRLPSLEPLGVDHGEVLTLVRNTAHVLPIRCPSTSRVKNVPRTERVKLSGRDMGEAKDSERIASS